jgi:ankyrin repeat protein
MIIAQLYDTMHGNTALLYAVEMNHTDCVRLLLESGVDCEVKNNVRACESMFSCALEYERLCVSVHY